MLNSNNLILIVYVLRPIPIYICCAYDSSLVVYNLCI